MVLISARDDRDLHGAVSSLADFQGRHTMRPIRSRELQELFETTRSAYQEIHPLEALVSGDTVEEVIYGSGEVQESIIATDGRGVAISQESVRRRAAEAGETGQLGEEAFGQWLLDSGHVEGDFEWVSQTHARAAYDFKVNAPRWEHTTSPLFVDVKTTRGAHEATLHLTMSEIRWAARHTEYRIARVSSLTETSAEIRILGNVTLVCQRLLESLSGLPSGISVDSVEVNPSLFSEVLVSRANWASEGDEE